MRIIDNLPSMMAVNFAYPLISLKNQKQANFALETLLERI